MMVFIDTTVKTSSHKSPWNILGKNVNILLKITFFQNQILRGKITLTLQLNLSKAATQKKSSKYVFKPDNRLMHVKSIADFFVCLI